MLCRRSELWNEIIGNLEDQHPDCIGEHLQLRCQQHPDRITSIQYPIDFKDVEEGGCGQPCEIILPCGHKVSYYFILLKMRTNRATTIECKDSDYGTLKKITKLTLFTFPIAIVLSLLPSPQCPAKCHVYPHEDNIVCRQPCLLIHPNCGHPCRRQCREKCGKCLYCVRILLNCGHEVEIACGDTATAKCNKCSSSW